jgi:di/tricarboxylate transporter
LQNTGVAEWVARSLVQLTVSWGRFALLFSVSASTSLINGLVSNNACMVLMFPICVTVRARWMLLRLVVVVVVVVGILVVGCKPHIHG